MFVAADVRSGAPKFSRRTDDFSFVQHDTAHANGGWASRSERCWVDRSTQMKGTDRTGARRYVALVAAAALAFALSADPA
jgi:hypothetical protein